MGNQIIAEHLSSSRLDLLKFKIKCEENNLKCVKNVSNQVIIVVKKPDYNKKGEQYRIDKQTH